VVEHRTAIWRAQILSESGARALRTTRLRCLIPDLGTARLFCFRRRPRRRELCRMNESVERLDCGSSVHRAVGEYVGAQTATVDQAAEDALGGEPFQV
jgi:hypothetical protein